MICKKLLINIFFRDPKRIKVWHNIALNVQKLVVICKSLKINANIQLFLRYMPTVIKQFLNAGMPILEHNLKYQTDDVTNILKMMQSKILFYYIEITRKHSITYNMR